MNKIIFFRYLPLTQKVAEDFCMSDLARLGYRVEYWDLSLLFWKQFSNVESYKPNEDDGIFITFFDSKRDLKEAVRNNRAALFISLMTFEWRILFIYWYFTIFHCKNAIFSFWPLPIELNSNPNESTILCRIRSKINQIVSNPSKGISVISYIVKNRIVLHLLLGFKVIKIFDYVFVGGETGKRGIRNVYKSELSNTKFYDVNYWDYDKFLKSGIHIENHHYMVFLDEYYPFHPDAVMMNQSKPIDPEPYYNELNSVFSKLEDFYKMPIIIAAHPKAIKYKERNYYDGRKVLFNSTMELVAHSTIVLAQDSLSTCTAVICNKPLIFINSIRMKEHCPIFYYQTLSYSNYFNSPMIFCDDFSSKDLPEDFTLPESRKMFNENFVKNYLSCIMPPQRNINLLEAYLKDIFKNDIN